MIKMDLWVTVGQRDSCCYSRETLERLWPSGRVALVVTLPRGPVVLNGYKPDTQRQQTRCRMGLKDGGHSYVPF